MWASRTQDRLADAYMARMAIQSRLFTRLAMHHTSAWAPRYGDVKIDEELDRDFERYNELSQLAFMPRSQDAGHWSLRRRQELPTVGNVSAFVEMTDSA